MIDPLNLDNSLPDNDSYRVTNFAGVVRFLTTADPIDYYTMSRVIGDLTWRDKLIADKLNELVGWQRDFTSSSNSQSGTTGGVDQQYVDSGDNSLRREIAILAARIRAVQSAKILATTWQDVQWQGGTKTRIRIPVGADPINFDQATSILVLWKADISKPSTAEPNPSPQWIYRQVQYGAETGFRVDDLFIEAPNVVNLVVPNTSTFTPYPSSTGYGAYTTARSLQVRVIISLTDEQQFSTDPDYDAGQIEFTPEELQNIADNILPLLLPEIDKVYGNIYPVGSIYLTVNDNVPTSLQRDGWTWIQIAAGKFLVGAGEGTDSNGTKRNFTTGDQFGEYSHKLLDFEIPSSSGSLDVEYNKSSSRGGGLVQTHVKDVSLQGGSGGEATAHNNVPPGFGLNVFMRTA